MNKREVWLRKHVINTVLNIAGITVAPHNIKISPCNSWPRIPQLTTDIMILDQRAIKKSLLNKIVNEAGLPTEANKWHKLAAQHDLVLVCYGSV